MWFIEGVIMGESGDLYSAFVNRVLLGANGDLYGALAAWGKVLKVGGSLLPQDYKGYTDAKRVYVISHN